MRMDPHYSTELTQTLNAAQAHEQALTGELSSGLRVSSLSVDAAAAAGNVQLAQSISRADAFVQTAATVQGRMQVTDTTLGDVVSELTTALSLATNAGSGTLNAENLSALAAQVLGIRDNVLANANSTYQGQYLFSGSQGGVKPFTLDATKDPAVATYGGDAVAQTVSTPNGQTLQINLAGSAVFSASGSDVLGTLNQLVSDLQAGSTSGIQADAVALKGALGNVTTQRAKLDSSLKRLTDSASYASSQEATLKATQSKLIGADPTEVATDLKAVEVQYEALLGTEALLNKENLFDFLK